MTTGTTFAQRLCPPVTTGFCEIFGVSARTSCGRVTRKVLQTCHSGEDATGSGIAQPCTRRGAPVSLLPGPKINASCPSAAENAAVKWLVGPGRDARCGYRSSRYEPCGLFTAEVA